MVLFLCSLGQLRSRTAELLCLFGGMNARSAGTDHNFAFAQVTDAALREADLVVCMQPSHRRAITELPHYDGSKVIELGIPDRFDRLEPALVRLLIGRIRPHAPEVAAAMERGRDVLAAHPGYCDRLGTHSPGVPADNPAFRVLPSV
ncbi:hypothetical protein [Burkholderia ambifaria]|uniref:hypothetical protein n=1 Tax=Burkholderia ambifaria TaxID=152480 RepID=UPI000F812011|nr:hypothetical protein [Burkholderia ambifaria]